MQPRSFELQLKTTWTVNAGIDGSIPSDQPKWVLTSIMPELSDDGEIIEIIGCMTEIS